MKCVQVNKNVNMYNVYNKNSLFGHVINKFVGGSGFGGILLRLAFEVLGSLLDAVYLPLVLISIGRLSFAANVWFECSAAPLSTPFAAGLGGGVNVASAWVLLLEMSEAALDLAAAVIIAVLAITWDVIDGFHINGLFAAWAGVAAAPSIHLHVAGLVADLGHSLALADLAIVIFYNVLLVKGRLVKHLLACPAFPVILL